MDDILRQYEERSKTEDLTKEQPKQVQRAVQALTGTKPSVSFCKATLADCIRRDGLNLNVEFTLIGGPSFCIPSSFPTPVASEFLCESLLRIQTVWALDNEKSFRILTDAILTEVLTMEENKARKGFCRVKNNWEGTGLGYTGNEDYMLGSSSTRSLDTMESCLLVKIARKEWPDSVPQVLCEAGWLLNRRVAAGKYTPVFAGLTNGFFSTFTPLIRTAWSMIPDPIC
jgi:hypothetical protein